MYSCTAGLVDGVWVGMAMQRNDSQWRIGLLEEATAHP